MNRFPDFATLPFSMKATAVTRADWEQQAVRELGCSIEDFAPAKPGEFLPHPLCTAADLAECEHLDSMPGSPPFLRGPYPTMYLTRPWTIRQYAGFSTAEASNAFFRRNLAAGQTGLSLAFDLPTHRGFDSDHPSALADAGKTGAAVNSVEDMKRLLHGIPLHEISVSMTMSGAVLPILAFFIVAAEEQGVPLDRLTGTIQNDILKEYLVRNAYIYPPGPSLRIIADILQFTARRMPQFHPISVSGYHLHEAGAPANLEIAYTIANAVEYVRAGLKAGLAIDEFAPRLSFFWAVGKEFFLEIAKIRAARVLWARVMKAFDPKNDASMALRAHAQTSGWSLTAQAPLNNVARTCVEALAAVLGQVQSLHTNAFDEAVALPTDFSARLALGTQRVLQTETGLCRVIDPLGGSFQLESMTQALLNHAERDFREIEDLGGMVKAIESGLPRRRIEEAAARRQAEIDSGRERIVGVNCHRTSQSEPVKHLEIDNEAVCETQVRWLGHLKQGRDAQRVRSSLAAITQTAGSGDGNLLERAIDAARARATLGEISEAMEKVFGRYVAEVRTITDVYHTAYADSEAIRRVRGLTEAFTERSGERPRLLIAKLGQDGHDRGARIVATALADFGFDAQLAPLFLTPEQAVRTAIEGGFHAIGVSSLAGAHKTLVSGLKRELEECGRSDIRLIIGGVVPEQDHAFLRENGAALILGPGTPLIEAAQQILETLCSRRCEAAGPAPKA